MPWRRRAAVAGAIVVGYLGVTSAFASATFDDGEVASTSVSSKRIFPTSQASTAWDIQDSSAGTAPVTTTDTWAAVDNRLLTTSTLTTSFSSTRYIELTLSSPLPAAVPVTAVTLNVTMAASGGGTGCIYAEIRRASTNALLGTQGSSTAPLACSSSTTQTTTTSALSYVTSSTDADDLKVKIFLRNSSSQRIAFDRVAVTGTAHSLAFTLLETTVANRSSGSTTTTPWSLASSDTRYYAPSSSWPAAFQATRYLTVNLPALAPEDATITAVTLRHAYASTVSAVQSCVYVELYNGSTLLENQGSSSSPLSCNSTTTQATDVMTLSEVDTVDEANALSLRIYVRNATAGATRHGLLTLTVDYSLA
jgi:hypothetical protein